MLKLSLSILQLFTNLTWAAEPTALDRAAAEVLLAPPNGIFVNPVDPKDPVETTFVITKGWTTIEIRVGGSGKAYLSIGPDGSTQILTGKDLDNLSEIIKAVPPKGDPDSVLALHRQEEITPSIATAAEGLTAAKTEGAICCEVADTTALLAPALTTNIAGVVQATTEVPSNKCDPKDKIEERSLMSGAGNCVSNLVFGIGKSLLDLGKFLYSGVKMAIFAPTAVLDKVMGTQYAAYLSKAVDKPFKAIANWWNGTEEVENATSDMMDVVANTPELEAAIKLFENVGDSPEKIDPGLMEKFTNFIWSGVTENFGCQQWDGIPHAPKSKCLKPWPGMECADLASKVSLACGTIGYLIGEVPSSYLLGGFLKYVAKGIPMATKFSNKTIDSVQNMLSKRLPQVIPPSKVINTQKIVASQIEKLTSKLGKLKSKKTEFIQHISAKIAANPMLKSKLPSQFFDLSGTVLGVTTYAARWYLRKLDIAFAKGMGGTSKVLLAKETHAFEDVGLAQKTVDELAESEVKIASDLVAAANLEKLELQKQAELVRHQKELAMQGLQESKAAHDFARRKYETSNLGTLAERFAASRVREELAAAQKAGKKLSDAEVLAIRQSAQVAGKEEVAKNIVMPLDAINLIKENPKMSLDELRVTFGARTHETWRAPREATKERIDTWMIKETARRDDMAAAERELFDAIADKIKAGEYPKFEPRIKGNNAGSDFAAKGDVEPGAIDIANTSFDDLTPFHKQNNMQAASNILGELQEFRGPDGLIQSALLDVLMPLFNKTDPEFLSKIAQALPASLPASDPVVIAAGHEFTNWSQRMNVTYAPVIGWDQTAEAVRSYNEHERTSIGAER